MIFYHSMHTQSDIYTRIAQTNKHMFVGLCYSGMNMKIHQGSFKKNLLKHNYWRRQKPHYNIYYNVYVKKSLYIKFIH